MTITIADEIKGLDEKLIRDEVANADDDIFARALAIVMPSIRQSVHGRARAYYTAQGEDGASDLPFVDDDAAVIDYYMNQQGYQDATKRAAVAASDEAKRMIPEIEKEIKNLEAGEETDEIKKQIKEYRAQIVEFQKQII